MKTENETLKGIVDEINKALETGMALSGEILPRFTALLMALYSHIYPTIASIRTKDREPYRESLLNYLDDLIQRGITPDEALRFIAKNEVKRLEGTSLGDILAATGEVTQNTLANSNLAEVLQQALAELLNKGTGPTVVGDAADLKDMTQAYPPVIADTGVMLAISDRFRAAITQDVYDIAAEYLPSDLQPLTIAEINEAGARGEQNCVNCPDVTCADNLWIHDLIRKVRTGEITNPKMVAAIIVIAQNLLEPINIPFMDANDGVIETPEE